MDTGCVAAAVVFVSGGLMWREDVVEIPGAREVYQLVGLDAGRASLNGVLPGLSVVVIPQAVNENSGMGGFRSGNPFD